jgi:hypothetical protein
MNTKRRKHVYHKLILGTTVVLMAVALILLGAIVYRTISSPAASPIPEEVSQKLTFSPMIIPSTNADFATSSYKIGGEDADTKVFSYIIKPVSSNASITVSEYIQPTEYSEIPEYKTQFLSNIAKQYATVQTSNGTIYLGRQTKLDNKQLAIMLERGLLIFFSPTTGDVDEITWRKIGDALELEKQ